jgi:hypothetical protein
MALLDPSTIIGGDPQTVYGVVSRQGQPGGADPVLIAKAHELGGSYDSWFVASKAFFGEFLTGPASEIPGGSAGARALKSIQQVSGGTKLGSKQSSHADVLTGSEEDAGMIADMLRGVFNDLTSPGFGKTTVATRGSSVHVDWSVSEADLANALLFGIPGAQQPGGVVIVQASPEESRQSEGEEPSVVRLPR